MSTIFYDNNPPLARCYKLTILVQPHSKKKNPSNNTAKETNQHCPSQIYLYWHMDCQK